MGKERTKVNPDRQRQHFSKEFKLEPVRLQEPGQKPPHGLALEEGIQRNLLYLRQKELQGKGRCRGRDRIPPSESPR